MDSEGVPSTIGHHPPSLSTLPVVTPIVNTTDVHHYYPVGSIDPMSLGPQHQYIAHQHHPIHEQCQPINEAVAPPTYDEIFPALPVTFNSTTSKVEMNGTGYWKPKNRLKPSNITQVFRVAPEERRRDNNMLEGANQAKICLEIMQQTATKIEMSNSKDGTLTFLISGKEESVLDAKRKVSSAIQIKAEKLIPIPKEHHKYILGKAGKKLADLEESTDTKISVPRQNESSDIIKIVGTKEAIEKAMHEILVVSNEAASRASERLSIPKQFHPFISGPFNEVINEIMKTTGAKINIPPITSNKDDILITGETNAVSSAKNMILDIYDSKKDKCTKVAMELKKAQHKYIVGHKGRTLQEIFKETGVFVEMPPSESNKETINLIGEHDKIGSALKELYDKAHSETYEEIETEAWVHRHILGKKGERFQNISQNFTDAHVTFESEEGKIKINGPRNDVEIAKKRLLEEITEIKKRVSVVELKIDSKYHRFIIGKNGSQIKQIRESSNATVIIPNEADNNASNFIRIEGSADAVKKAEEQIEEIIKKQKERENIVTKELYIDQRFHRQLIGLKGDTIKEIRSKFNQVAINFPEPTIKSDKVIIRGAKEDVEECHKYLAQRNKDLLANNYRIEVPIFKQFHKLVIGKEKARIHKIRTETETKIDIPPVESNSETIVITGKKDNVEKAKEQIEKIQKELGNYVQTDIIIPAKYHNFLIGSKGRQLNSIRDQCNGVIFNFPQEGSGSDKISIIGPKEMVAKAKQQLIELKNERQENSYTVEIKVKPVHHKYIIGKHINTIKDKNGVRISFPNENEDSSNDAETITIVGKKENVDKAKAELSELIKDLEKAAEATIEVPSKYQIIIKKLLNHLKDEAPSVNSNFREGRISLNGPSEAVHSIKKAIEDKIDEMESEVTITVSIDQKHHSFFKRNRGNRIKTIQQDFNVNIQFPKREINGMSIEEDMVNGNVHHEGNERNDALEWRSNQSRESEIFKITGRKENCEKAKDTLIASIPVTQEVGVPFIYHKFIIGLKGKDIKTLNDTYDVITTVPPLNEQSSIITVTGCKDNVENAIKAIKEKVQKCEEQQQDKEARSYKFELTVDSNYLRHIIGKKGVVISKIKTNHSVQIQFPEKTDKESQSDQSVITIIGYEHNVHDAKEEIMKVVQELKDMITSEIHIDNRAHRILIGTKGKNIKKIMDQFKVEIKLPRENLDRDLVVITGKPENVENVKEELLKLADEYLDYLDEQYMPPRKQLHDYENRPSGESRGFYVKGGPWEQQSRLQIMPDTNNAEEFPSMCEANNAESITETPKMGWGLDGARVVANSRNNN